MKNYHIFFFFLKVILSIHILLILFNTAIEKDNILYLIDESFFKLSIGLLLGVYFLFSSHLRIDLEDRLIISVAGFVILYDIDYAGLYALWKSKYTDVRSTHQATPSS